MNVGIVGGSIAGCLMALELLGAGHRVTVFERSRGELQGLLGAGLGTPTPMFRTLVERGLVDGSEPEYRGYIRWRGVLDEREMDAGELMRSTFARFGCKGMAGVVPVSGAGRRRLDRQG